MRKIFVILLILLCAFTLPAQEKEHLLTVLFTNDIHGMAWQYDEPGNPGIGGLAAMKTLVDQIRAEVQGKGGDILVLMAGDTALGDPRSNVCHNLPVTKGMNLIGFDASVVGNHDLFFGIDVFNEMKQEAKFDWISANIYIYKDGGTKPLADREYIEKHFESGLKVGILGLSTREIEQITTAGLEGKIIVTDPIQEAKTRVPILRKNNDIVIALTHLGYFDTDRSYDGFEGDNFLAKSVSGIDLIIGGHTHRLLQAPVKIGDTFIVQTEGMGRYLGRFDFVVKGGKIIKTNFKLYPINLKKKVVVDNKVTYEFVEKEIKENKAMLEMLAGFKCDFSEEVLGTIETPLEGSREEARFREIELGDIIADIMRERGKTDIAFFNAGSIRQGLPAGKITERELYTMFPFMDTLVIGKIKGSELQEVLDHFAEKGEGAGGFLQISGFSMKIYKGMALDIKIGGKPLDKNKVYTFTTNSFLANGGDGYTMLKNLKNKKDTFIALPVILVEYLKKYKKFPKPEMGRLSITK